LVDGTLKLDLGHRNVVLRAWPTAHSDNDLTVLDEQTGTLFAGDLAFRTHIPVLDGKHSWLANRYRRAQRYLCATYGPPVTVPVSGLGGRPLSTNAAIWKSWRRMFVGWSPAASRNGSRDTAAASERSHWELFDDFNARNATAAFSEIEWE